MSKAKATKLLQTALAGVPGKSVHVVHFSAPPGFVGGRHSHPGPAFVYILEGQLTITMDGDAPVTLGPGDLFEEPVGNKVMQATNESSTHGVMCGRLPVGKVSFDVDASWSGAVMCGRLPVGKVSFDVDASWSGAVMCGRLPVGKVSFDVDASWSGAVMCPAC